MNESTTEYAERLVQIDNRLNEIPEVRKKLFEEKLSGTVSGEVFADIMTSLDAETESLKAERNDCLAHVNTVSDMTGGVEIFLARLGRYRDFEVLTAEMVEELIDRIDVYEPTVINAYTKKPKISIYYIGVGNIEDMRK